MLVVKIIVGVFVVAFLIWLLTSTAVVVRQGEVKVVESFGKYVKTLEPGLHFLIPILYTVRERVSLKQIPLEIEPQSAITKDNVMVEIDEAIKYHVTDVRAFVYDNENSVVSMIQDAQSNLRGIIGKMELNEVLNGTEEINASLFASIKDITSGYGLAIDRINIGEIKVSKEIVESMNKLITASRDKESMITRAEGEKSSAVLNAEANASNKMTIDAQARVQQTQIDAEARAKRIRIDAEAEADRIEKITEAEKKRIIILNEAIKNSQLDEVSLSYLGIEAFKEVVSSQTNTIILPSNMT
ncbi:TPA: SPFH domain-containing protein [Enterococcus faecium]